jgi:hypothetical protein
MAPAPPPVPAEHAGDHLLLVPAGGALSLPALAAAWFAEVVWLRQPVVTPAPRHAVGARFRGARAAAADERSPGVLRVDGEHVVVGPFPVGAEDAAALEVRGGAAADAYAVTRTDGAVPARGPRPASHDDRDGVARAFAAGLPQGAELRAVQWAVAVARKTGGSVLTDGRTLLAPDPAAAVDLVLYAAHALAPDDLLRTVRALVAAAEPEAGTEPGLEPGPEPGPGNDVGPGPGSRPPAPGAPPAYGIVARTPYDGALSVRVERVDRVPRALGALGWREYGPCAYRLRWLPPDTYELQVERPSALHVIARGRMRSTVARLALALREHVGGVLVDDGGFLATTAELTARLGPGAAGTGAWV